MPKGVKAITWTPDNDARLFLTILAVENVKPNLKKVAEVFGTLDDFLQNAPYVDFMKVHELADNTV